MPTQRNRSRSRPLPGTTTSSTSTREQLIDVGLELMRRHGYGATGLQEILHLAHVAKGSFYHYFASKEEFAFAVIERYDAINAEHCRQFLGNTRLAPLNRLRRYFDDPDSNGRGSLRRFPDASSEISGLEVAGTSPLLQGRLSSGFAHWQSCVASVLREAVEKGDLRQSTKPEPLAGFLLNSWEGALLLLLKRIKATLRW